MGKIRGREGEGGGGGRGGEMKDEEARKRKEGMEISRRKLAELGRD